MLWMIVIIFWFISCSFHVYWSISFFVEFLSSFDAHMNSLSQLLIISAKLEKHNEEESS
jgi:hypothetical protein